MLNLPMRCSNYSQICLKHARQIKAALGISGLATEVGSWRYVAPRGNAGKRGAQIDLLFDRDDGVINLCELKYSESPFRVDKAYARELHHKIEAFREITAAKKQLFLTLVTPRGLKPSIWSEDLVDSVVRIEDLFA